MKISFDHIVHYVHNPSTLPVKMKEYGLFSNMGGKHPNWGTHNSLSYFMSLAYLEWIGFENKDIPHEIKHPFSRQLLLDSDREGFSMLAVRTENIQEVADQLRKKGYTIAGPLEGSRKRDDGTVLSWKMLFMEDDQQQELLPFFIEWNTSDGSRKIDLIQQGILRNPSDMNLNYVGIAVTNPEESSCKWFEILSGQAANRGAGYCDVLKKDYHEIEVNGIGIRFFDVSSLRDMEVIRPGKPFVAGIKGAGRSELTEINGAYYHFER